MQLVRRLGALRARHRKRLDVAAVVFCFLVPVAAVLLVYGGPEPPRPTSPRQAIRRLAEADLDDQARQLLLGTLRGDQEDVELHHDLLAFYFFDLHGKRDSTVAMDREIRRLYETRRLTGGGRAADVAAFALGEYWRHRDDDRKAIACYASVQDSTLPYLNASWGASLVALGDEVTGTMRLQRELALGHDVHGAVWYLARQHVRHGDWPGLESLLADPALARHVPLYAQRSFRLHRLQLVPYAGLLVATELSGLRWTAVLVALFGSLIWFLLVRWWDVFDKEPLGLSIRVVLLGGAFGFLIFVYHDLRAQWGVLGFDERSPIAWILQVGMPEEIVKFLPLLLVRWFTKAIDEPIDWVVYGCLAALGFSVVENCDYISTFGLNISAGRIFGATPIHVALTGFWALCIPWARARSRPLVPVLAAGFLLVASAHGLVDYFFTRKDATSHLGFLLALGSMVVFVHTLEGIRTASPFRNHVAGTAFSCTRWFLAAYVLVCVAVLFLNAGRLQHAQAIEAFGADLGAILLFSLSMSAYTRFRLRQLEVRAA